MAIDTFITPNFPWVTVKLFLLSHEAMPFLLNAWYDAQSVAKFMIGKPIAIPEPQTPMLLRKASVKLIFELSDFFICMLKSFFPGVVPKIQSIIVSTKTQRSKKIIHCAKQFLLDKL